MLRAIADDMNATDPASTRDAPGQVIANIEP